MKMLPERYFLKEVSLYTSFQELLKLLYHTLLSLPRESEFCWEPCASIVTGANPVRRFIAR